MFQHVRNALVYLVIGGELHRLRKPYPSAVFAGVWLPVFRCFGYRTKPR